MWKYGGDSDEVLKIFSHFFDTDLRPHLNLEGNALMMKLPCDPEFL